MLDLNSYSGRLTLTIWRKLRITEMSGTINYDSIRISLTSKVLHSYAAHWSMHGQMAHVKPPDGSILRFISTIPLIEGNVEPRLFENPDLSGKALLTLEENLDISCRISRRP